MALAIFDLDNTLINGDSDHAWGEYLCEKGIVDPEVYRLANDKFYHQYGAGSLDINEFLHFALTPLKNHKRQQLLEWHSDFMSSKVMPMLLPKALQRLKMHRDQGDYLLIITATNLFVTEPIAQLLKVDAILATEPELVNGEYTGDYVGNPCFQSGKITRLEQWLTDNPQEMSGSYFYSDSRNDLPLLDIVTHPVVVDADEHLLKIAEQRNWPSISFR
jgi:HAD superfamily hydrolase (TIGR01490 family)